MAISENPNDLDERGKLEWKSQHQQAYSKFLTFITISQSLTDVLASADSGQETGTVSDSSRYATSNKRWVDLERSEQNNTTGDTGFKSDSSRQSDRSMKNKLGKHKFMGPYNAFQTSIASLNEKGALRKNDVDVSFS